MQRERKKKQNNNNNNKTHNNKKTQGLGKIVGKNKGKKEKREPQGVENVADLRAQKLESSKVQEYSSKAVKCTITAEQQQL